MKVFLSYSLNDSNLYVIPMLVTHLKKQNMEVLTSYETSNIAPFNNFQSMNASLFIALLTKSGNQNEKVSKEWNNAIKSKIPTIALIENSFKLPDQFNNWPNIIRFDRTNPSKSISQIQANRTSSVNSEKNDSNALAWILGGIAAIALIKLLSDDD
jgi:3-methyladenine DNA glycosylase AlkC